MSPETVRIHLEVSSLILAVSGEQSPVADAKQNIPFEPAAMDDDNPTFLSSLRPWMMTIPGTE